MKIWLDDIRKRPDGDWLTVHSVNDATTLIEDLEELKIPVDLISLDHDLGDYADQGGDGIKLLDWLLERGTLYPVELHTMNPVGRENMRRMIDRYWPITS